MGRYAKPEKLPTVIMRLAWKRKLVGLTKRELSLRMGYHESTVYHWERGFRVPSFFNLICWADALGVEIEIREK